MSKQKVILCKELESSMTQAIEKWNPDRHIEKENEQKSFLETTLGKTINAGLDIGIRALLPDFIDE